jgi:hypothetical protein
VRRCALLFLIVLACSGCTGGVFIDAPSFPGQSCPTCWDDLHQGPDSRGRRF